LWTWFGVLMLLAWLLPQLARRTGHQFNFADANIVLLLVSLAVGGWIVWLSNFERQTVALVVLGVLVGQWRGIETVVTFAFWAIRGFAP